MSKRLHCALLGISLAATTLATEAEARLDHGPVASTYGEERARPSAKSAAPRRSERVTPSRRKSARHNQARRSVLKSRAMTAGHGGGGTSRDCLKPEARALLGQIESQFGPVEIVSTCRPGAVIAGSGKPSKHRYGLAIDFSAGARKGAIVQWLLANHHAGGTMTYSRMSHIHVDIGQRFVSLNSGGGRGRRTASLRKRASRS